jgi:ABC-type multidrug transport system ATPase subunit
MISLTNIKKTYPGRAGGRAAKGKDQDKNRIIALNDVSFSVEKGELFGLIGPDGAGKTSLFRILTTLLLPDQGEATVNHYDIRKDYQKIRNCVGYMPGRFSLYQDLTVEENLNFFATVFGTTIKENYDLIKDIYQQIEPFKDRRAGKLSGGMKQKLALSCALIHKPSVLFLDEPTTGVDVVSRKEFWAMLKKLQQDGITILVSTPYMDEANLCDRIALIQKGDILSIDKPVDIVRSFPGELYAVHAADTHRLLENVRNYPGTATCFAFGDSLHVTFKGEPSSDSPAGSVGHPVITTGSAAPQALLEYLRNKGHADARVERTEPTIEDCFIHLLKN